MHKRARVDEDQLQRYTRKDFDRVHLGHVNQGQQDDEEKEPDPRKKMEVQEEDEGMMAGPSLDLFFP